MARDQSLLSSTTPISIAPGNPFIAHVQLRDLLICPREQGVVNYVSNRAIIEQDLHAPGARSRVLAPLDFIPNSLASIPIGENDTLIAAGGQETELHLSYHTSSPSSRRSTRMVWELETRLTGSINNSVLLTSLNLTGSHQSSVEPRVVISNNDESVRFYDVPMRVQSSRRMLAEIGVIRLDVPVNHSSISPDGRTLLSVGDSNKVYFHRISGGAQLTLTPITNLVIPPPDVIPLGFSSSSLVASFSTAFSRDGSKFAVASQEGVIAVWDVRSTKPIKVFHTDKSRGMRPMVGNGAASGWLSDDPWEWTRGTKAPGWCARNVKFNGGEGAKLGKEVMVFTEHTSVVHVVDALTFETHDIVRLPSIVRRPSQFRRHLRQSSAPSIIISSPENNASSSITAAQQRQTQRNLIRRVHPVSNTRRTPAPTPASGSVPTATRRPTNSMILRPDAGRTRGAGLAPISSSIRALGDTFRIPASAYSAPSSISDSTWRTLNDEMPVGPFVSGGTTSLEPMASTASPPLLTSPQMPALLALADFALDPISELRDLREDAPEDMREDEGALSRRIRREESALRGMQIERELFEDDGASGISDSNVAEYAPSGSGTATDLGGAHRGRQRRWESDAGIVVVPDLGDREMESEVHALLTRHGIRTRFSSRRRVNDENGERQGSDVVSLDDGSDDEYGTEVDRDTNTGSTHGDYEYPLFGSRRRIGVNRISRAPVENVVFDEAEEESMDVDDTERDEDSQDEIHPGEVQLDIEGEGEEIDCVSNSNSRSASPVLALGSPTPTTHNIQTSFEREGKGDDDGYDYGFGDAESREAYYTGFGSSSTAQPDLAYYDDLDIAGICFDPWGERMYVAGMGTNVVGDDGDRVFAGGFGGPGRDGVGNKMGTVVEWGVRGADKRFWVDEGWM